MDLLWIGLVVASIASLAWLGAKGATGRAWLPYEPRDPVPWSGAAPLALMVVVLTPTLLAFGLNAVSPGEGAAPAAAPEEYQLNASDLWAVAGLQVLLTMGCVAMLSAAHGARDADLGLPPHWASLRRDAVAGSIAFLAVLLPVYAVQTALVLLLGEGEEHAILKTFGLDQSAQYLAAAAVAGTVATPLFEELAFRVILQGYLERKGLGRIVVPAPAATPTESPEAQPAAATLGPNFRGDWIAIGASSLVFSAAHLGQGFAPISLFPLGLTLGYLYQRTHRIFPSIVCHALFNGMSLLAAWSQAGAAAE